jgi:tellurite resistance-related uncharacterized protein
MSIAKTFFKSNLMKNILSLLLLAASSTFAQENYSRSFEAQGVNKIEITFDYPQLVMLKTWNKTEVKIEGNVNINNHTEDDAFKLKGRKSGNYLSIDGSIEDIHALASYEKYYDYDDEKEVEEEKVVFTNQEGLKQMSTPKKKRKYKSYGPDIDITLVIYVPENTNVQIEVTYGLIEVNGFLANLVANSPYTGVDIVVPKDGYKKLEAHTQFGEILTNLTEKPVNKQGSDDIGEWSTVVYTGKNVYTAEIKSQYGKVYLRKQQSN